MDTLTGHHCKGRPRNPYSSEGIISTDDLLVLNSLDLLLLKQKLCFYILNFYKTTNLNVEVNFTKPCPLVFPG